MLRFCLLVLCVVLTGCTQNQMVKNFGGAAMLELTRGQKLVNLTWKEDNLWILTRTMREGESPERYTFSEKSNLGVWEGNYTIVETKP